mmetsp:Transcript_13091/g.30983  ORF Transcript_13091/g.30983 Transcript_13091/m.30983 type:complete len:158 (-) Transcript_13091:157-630(-)|eukprot:CAMPEP_0113649232 /NCGR_PEP_ID=MMETSP0017_2-20120614/26155_1 /TAXON_ID=2856 /ORGANISM="Cylindrotheca closterium" /LENGTH=157 /DNA_ID=CAMNT_0000561583 /DNA_START=116 /DNA_END=589 /DNA_ORIENTATION=- /assembly_acc=CAM_ASM_000147
MSDLNQKQALFRSASATIYLCNSLRSILYAFQGFPAPNLFRFVIGAGVLALNMAMVFVYTGRPPMALAKVESIRFPTIPGVMTEGESFFTYKGRLVVDGITIFCLWFLMGSHFLGFVTAALLAAATYFKTQQPDLYTELFRESGDGGGNYQSVDNMI